MKSMGLLRCLSLENEIKIIASLCLVGSLLNISLCILSILDIDVMAFGGGGFNIVLLLSSVIFLVIYLSLLYAVIKKKTNWMRPAYYAIPFFWMRTFTYMLFILMGVYGTLSSSWLLLVGLGVQEGNLIQEFKSETPPVMTWLLPSM